MPTALSDVHSKRWLKTMPGPTRPWHAPPDPRARHAGSGGCFPVHFDSDEAVDARRLTAILYLSDPAWQPEWGGQLRLYPVATEPVDILPAEASTCCCTCRGMPESKPSRLMSPASCWPP